MKKLFLLALAVMLCSCARPAPQPAKSPEAMHAWEKMQDYSRSQTQPYRLSLSMRFGEEGDTRRVTGLLWGNGEEAFRLDVMAGVGAMVAMISETGEKFVVYAPRENKAYFHNGDARPLLKIGVPAPFNLAQLAGLLTGRYAEVFGSEPASARLADGNSSYSLEGPLAGELEVAANGAPLAWRQQHGGWTLAAAYSEESPLLPKSLKLHNANGKMAIILVKEREIPKTAFDARQLSLTLPQGAPLLPLSQFKAR